MFAAAPQINVPHVQSRMKVFPNVPIAAAVLSTTLALVTPAFASLGGNVASVQSDRARLNASIHVTQAESYSVQQMQSPGGTQVKEFVSPEGNVFAVSWQGQFPPDLQQVLGSYYQQYVDALAAQPKHYGHRPLNIQLPGLVIPTAGHMRDYFGRAYIPDQLPTGMKAEDIK